MFNIIELGFYYYREKSETVKNIPVANSKKQFFATRNSIYILYVVDMDMALMLNNESIEVVKAKIISWLKPVFLYKILP